MDEIEQNNPSLQALQNLRRRLLDLTARNRLINFRHTKRSNLRIIDELPDQLVETLLDDKKMRFLPVPEPSRDELIKAGYIEIDEESGQEVRLRQDPTAEEWAKHLGLSTAYEVPKPAEDGRDDRHSDTAIQTLLYPYQLERRLKNLLQIAESAIQEMGANILYLGFGFLEWFDNNNDNPRIAPLFLVPVRLHKGQLNHQTKIYEYTLSYSGEDIIPNLSLREKLRIDFAAAVVGMEFSTGRHFHRHRPHPRNAKRDAGLNRGLHRAADAADSVARQSRAVPRPVLLYAAEGVHLIAVLSGDFGFPENCLKRGSLEGVLQEFAHTRGISLSEVYAFRPALFSGH